MSAELNSDKPISREKEDLLGRHPLAYRIAEMINDLGDDYNDSVVIGIEGEWGAGKSSFINLILNRVRPNERNLVIEFNPWNFSNQNELIKDFFDSIAEGVDKPLAKKIKDYALKLLAHTDLEPSLSFLGVTARLGGWKFRHNSEKPLKRQRDDIVNSFSDLERRIIIVIDDIDRLDGNETKLIFKLVKLVANFPNTVFLLAYDKDKVGKFLGEEGLEGSEYLKKIVQIPFLIPKPNPRDIFGVLASALSEELSHKGFGGETEKMRQYGAMLRTLEDIELFPTIRDIRRYTNSLRLDLKIIGKEEVNLVDFVGVEAIRVFAPELYLEMAGEKFTFTAPKADEKSSWQKDRRERVQEIIAKAPKGLNKPIKEIIDQLFPQLKTLDSKSADFSDPQRIWRKERRVCSKDMFDRYFSLSVPQTLLSESELRDFLSTVNDIPALLEKWGEFWEKGKLQLVSERIRDHLDDLNGQQRENLLVSLFDFVEGVGYGESGILSFGGLFDSTYEGRRIMFSILRKFEREKRVEFLTKLINTTKGFFLMTKFLDDLEGEQSACTSPEGDEPSLFSDEMDILRTAYIAKVKKAVDNGSLAHGKQWGQTLLAWKEWGVKGEAEAYIAELLKTDENLPAVLRGFSVKVTTVAKDEAKLKRTREINKGALGRVTDLEKINKRVEQLDVNKLSEEDAKVVELYKNQPEDPEEDWGWWG